MPRRDDPGDHGAGTSPSSDRSDKDWIILLEATDTRAASTIDPAQLARLVSAWATPSPTTLYSPSRYALQLPVRAANPPMALALAISLWEDALRHSGLPEWELVRTEVLTPDELQRELDAAEWASGGAPPRGEDVVGDELLRRALHDPVTGLASRELFLDGVREALATRAGAAGIQAVMVVHLDGLGIGDCSVGPPSDEVLSEIAGRLAETLRAGDMLARVGRTELALLVEVPSSEQSSRVAGRIVDFVRRWLPQAGQRRGVLASVGVATTPCGGDADQVIVMAEAAMAAARDAGGDCHRLLPASHESV